MEGCPEYNRYMTRSSRQQGHALQPKTKVLYMPLLNHKPSDPSTMLTAMLKARKLSSAAGQEFTVFTVDQQLYRVCLQIIWDDPSRFQNFCLRHLLMSFISASGSLMAGSGEDEVLSAVFGGVAKILAGKKFPDNVRALRMLVEELLRPILISSNHNIKCMADLQEILDQLSQSSRTCKLWIDCLIRPVFIILKYVCAEREGDWHLNLLCVEAMIPYFFAAGHVNYARYALYYFRFMLILPDKV